MSESLADIVQTIKMDLKNKITSMEEVLMRNPFQKRSHRVSRTIAANYNYYTDIYPPSVTSQLDTSTTKSVKLPKVIFIPDKSVLRCMILANVKFSKKDSVEEFLLRFGMVEDEEWHVK